MIPTLGDAANLLGDDVPASLTKLHGDGSERTFWRVKGENSSYILLSGPNHEENGAYVRIANHLSNSGVRVPKIYGFDEPRGLILMEDLGDTNLLAVGATTADKVALYEPVLQLLVKMQVVGRRGFSLSTGFAPAPYSTALMVEGEGLYFLGEFVQGVLGLRVDEGAFREELFKMAALAEKAPSDYFLHRDFQSRNLQLAPDSWAVIDFQGARPGPLAYDAAALILDPYAALDRDIRLTLKERYCGLLSRTGEVDVEAFLASWPLISAFRLMQALGAYGKLGHRLKKPGFLEHCGTALGHLEESLADPVCRPFSAVRKIVGEAALKWRGKLD